MVDVFVSYSRKDETDTGRVRLVARSLEKLGYQVFLDQKIPPGADFRSYLEARLQEAKCVLVLWSIASIKSPWVIDEATYAREQGKLLPACLDNNAPPMGFRALQSVSLDGWNGEHDHAEWLKLLHEIESRCGTPRPRGALRVTSQSPWHLILLVDDSNSMVGKPAQDMADGLKAMLAQFEIISKSQKSYFNVTIISFGTTAQIRCEYALPMDIDPSSFDDLKGQSGSTNLAAALLAAKEVLDRNPGNRGDFTPYVFLLTDGPPDDADQALFAATRLKETEVPAGRPKLITIALSGDCDHALMKRMSTTPEFYLHLTNSSQLINLFPNIGDVDEGSGNAAMINL